VALGSAKAETAAIKSDPAAMPKVFNLISKTPFRDVFRVSFNAKFLCF